MPAWLAWWNVERASLVVALAAAVTAVAAVIYARRQADIADKAKNEARRSADAAEEQVRIAKAAKEEARRAADAARAVVKIEARREHQAGAVKEIQLLRVEQHPNRALGILDLFAVFKNTGQRVYRYDARLLFGKQSYTSLMQGELQPGETASVYLCQQGMKYYGVELWCDGDCPCDQPDGTDGHWRCFYPAQEPDNEPPSLW